MLSLSDQVGAAPGPAPLKRKITAILAADVAGYSRLVAADEEGTLHALAAAREIFDAAIRSRGGRIFNTAGDSVMCEFDSAVEAVRAAVDIQAALAVRDRDRDADRRIAFRIGISIGDVVERGGDLLGDGVNLAARLEGLAPAGGICVSRSVQEAVANKVGVGFRDLGLQPLKNLPQAVQAYLVVPPGESAAAEIPVEPRRLEAPAGQRRRVPFLRLALILLAVAFGIPAAKEARHAFEAWLAPGPPAQIAAASTDRGGATRGEATQDAGHPTGDAAPRTGPQPRGPLPADPAAAFAALARDGVLPEATTLPELYHNARVLETKGDRPAALRAYAAAATKAGDVVDVPVRYAALLGKGPVPPELARERARAATLVAILTGTPTERRARVEAWASARPGDPVAAYLLAESYLGAPGGPTLTERRLAFDALESFLEANTEGRLAASFVDRAFLTGWAETARRRRDELQAGFAGNAARLTATFSRSNDGWSVTLTLPEPAQSIAVRVGEQGEFAPAGAAPAAGATVTVELPAQQSRTVLYVTYRDRAGREAGPFPMRFDPAQALAESGREVLERYPESWISFRRDLPDVVSYGQLVGNRCAIRQALVGFGDAEPREPLPLPPCDSSTQLAGGSDGRSVLTLPTGTDSVQVQLTYADGSESQPRTFRRP